MARVLVAEDDGLTRRFIEETLEFAGHEVTSVVNSAEAIGCVDAEVALALEPEPQPDPVA